MSKDKEFNENSIIEYVKRNTKSFDEEPFNNVDSLVLSEFSYCNFDNIVPSIINKKQYVTIANLPKKMKDKICLVTYKGDRDPELFDALQESSRYKNVKICYFVSEIDTAKEYEFSAVTYILNKKYLYIAYRGTTSMLGWKEDFNMSYMPNVPSQLKARDYLKQVLKSNRQKVFLGGHSKGGNIAAYAAATVNIFNMHRIKKAYLHDSPGFREDTVSKFRLKLVLKKIDKTIPVESIVGMLLNTTNDYKVVENTRKGVMQHDAFSWVVKNNDFSYLKKRNKKSLYYEKTIKDWLNGIPDDKRKLFVDNLYYILLLSGAKDIWDLPKSIIKNVNKINKTISKMDEESQKSIKGIIVKFTKSAINNLEIKEKITGIFKSKEKNKI